MTDHEHVMADIERRWGAIQAVLDAAVVVADKYSTEADRERLIEAVAAYLASQARWTK